MAAVALGAADDGVGPFKKRSLKNKENWFDTFIILLNLINSQWQLDMHF